jgi:hypothetical protein
MIKLYTDEEFSSAKSTEKLKLECENCHAQFYGKKNDIKWSEKCGYRKILKYCGTDCRNVALNKGKIVKCKVCDLSFYRKNSLIKRSKTGNQFCSNSCAAKYNNEHFVRKSCGCRRSKLEKYLEEKLKKTFPTLEIRFNQRKDINSELDIYIPSLRLAFELNGIFHYKPIFGKDKLVSTVKNDKKKVKSCLENSIKLVVIDISDQKHFNDRTSEKYLEIILRNVENSNLNAGLGRPGDFQSPTSP